MARSITSMQMVHVGCEERSSSALLSSSMSARAAFAPSRSSCFLAALRSNSILHSSSWSSSAVCLSLCSWRLPAVCEGTLRCPSSLPCSPPPPGPAAASTCASPTAHPFASAASTATRDRSLSAATSSCSSSFGCWFPSYRGVSAAARLRQTKVSCPVCRQKY